MKVTGRPPRGSKVRCEFDVRREEAFGECLKRLLQGFLAAPGVPDLEPGLMALYKQPTVTAVSPSIHGPLGAVSQGRLARPLAEGKGRKS